MVLLVLGLGFWTLRDVSWAPLRDRLIGANPLWIGVATAVNLVVVFLRAVRWLALVKPLSKSATLGQAFESVVVGLAFSTVLPARAGELVRARMFSRMTGLAGPSVLTTIGLDYLVNAAGLVVGLLVLPLIIEVPPWIRPGALTAFGAFVASAIAAFALRPIARDSLTTPVGFLALARQGLGAVSQPRALGLSLAICLASWALEIEVVAFSLTAVGLDLPFSAACLVLLAVNLAVALPLQPPGSLGTLEVGVILALEGLGVGKEQALACGLIYHLLQVVPVGTVGLVLWWRDLLRH
jgi:uncharacterized membrane protein YbhN (UPF0104 family)